MFEVVIKRMVAYFAAAVISFTLFATVERTASVYHSYEFASVADTPAPKGFAPFYIAHYGRHGSRRMTGTFAADTLEVLEKAEKAGRLTDEGMALLADVRKIAEAHAGMVGQLTERGAEEHRRLACRMVERFPEVFASARRVRCQSSIYPRVLISQANFTMALKDAAPLLSFDFATGDKFQDLLNGPQLSRDEVGADARIKEAVDAFARGAVDPLSLVKRLFSSDFVAGDSLKFVRNLFVCASNCQCLRHELAGLDIYRYFQADEIESLSRALAVEDYAAFGNSLEFGDIQLRGSRNLARDFARRADEAIADGRIAADLRFGHDSGLWPLVGLMGLEGPGDRVPLADSWQKCPAWKWMPMASNIQMVFYRNDVGEVLVKILYNEREMRIKGHEPVYGAFYRWQVVMERLVPTLSATRNVSKYDIICRDVIVGYRCERHYEIR